MPIAEVVEAYRSAELNEIELEGLANRSTQLNATVSDSLSPIRTAVALDSSRQ